MRWRKSAARCRNCAATAGSPRQPRLARDRRDVDGLVEPARRRIGGSERVKRRDIRRCGQRAPPARRAAPLRPRRAARHPTAVARIHARPASACRSSARSASAARNCAAASAGRAADRQQLRRGWCAPRRCRAAAPPRGGSARAPRPAGRRAAAARRGCCAPARSRDRSAAPPRTPRSPRRAGRAPTARYPRL